MAFYRAHILVDSGTAAVLKGANAVRNTLIEEIKSRGLDKEIKVVETGALGLAGAVPAIVVYPEGVTYANVTVEDVPEIVEEHLLKGRRVQRLVYKDDTPAVVKAAGSARSAEMRVVLKNIGVIDPTSIDEYIAMSGYEALAKALTAMTPEDVIAEMKASGLNGRGGAGFPTGLKWEFTAKADGDIKYIVCNADEGEPGNFKDRLIMEGDPHQIIEGMVIAAYATGAQKGFIYIRGEYQQSVANTERAIDVAREMGLLGCDIMGSGLNFDIEVFKGAGAYICGEETALLASIEGFRGESRVKPPYPPTHGLFGKPTVINNVETLANVPHIIVNGAQWYSEIGTARSKGTKIFSPCGDVQYPGVYEVPFGSTLREVIFGMAGGIKSGKKFKAVLMGGPSGVLVGEDALDRRLCSEDLNPGAGALIVLDETKCVVDLIRNCAQFFLHESCGQCTPCREGTKRMVELFDWWAAGSGSEQDLMLADQLATTMALTSRCGLGQFAGVAFKSSISLFEDEYLAHLADKSCPAGVCDMDKVEEEVRA
ncbi:MAG: NADP oxidoreductase [Armatimonadetes bacterium]|jgi:NADH:ubiquinone oxidoreductase subunit F (NADH-binding)/(2Fe-2S) ferredoxin|nr:NADP oxidoreductase [Armatimonadota bacterium]